MARWSHFSVQITKSLNLFNSNLEPFYFFYQCNRPHNKSLSLLLPASIWWLECVRASLLWRSPQCQLFVCSLLFFLTSTAPLLLLSLQPLPQCCSAVLWLNSRGGNNKRKFAAWKKTEESFFLLLSFWCFLRCVFLCCCDLRLRNSSSTVNCVTAGLLQL